MLSKPDNGWVLVTVGDFRTEASYLADLPFDWLRSCIHSLRFNLPLSLFIEEEGTVCYINAYYSVTHIICEDSDFSAVVHTVRDMDMLDLTYQIICDIRAEFEDWVSWYDFEQGEAHFARRRTELAVLLDEAEQLLREKAKLMHKSFK